MLFYNVVPGATQTTNATPNTENDCLFIAPSAARGFGLYAIYPTGKGANLTSISGIQYRVKKWTTTASSGGSAITPTPTEGGYSAAAQTAGFSAAAVTPGTGGPTLMLSIGSGTTSPGPWIAPNKNEDALRLYANDTKSLDIFNSSGAASLNFEVSLSTFE